MEVEDGVVTLTGLVEDDDVRERVRVFVLRVQGVNLVINQMKTDAQVLTAPAVCRSGSCRNTGG